MKKKALLSTIICAIGLLTACNCGTQSLTSADFADIKEYIAADDENFKVDSINGYSTFSTDNRIAIIPEQITQKQYEQLLTDRYTLQPIPVDTNSTLYAELYELSNPASKRYDIIRGYDYDSSEILQEMCKSCRPIYHFPQTKQYEFVMYAPLTNESFMMTEDHLIDTTFMQSDTRTYGTNRIFVGQEGFRCATISTIAGMKTATSTSAG